MQPQFDVAVVGSGPAGSASALRLCREGFSVALIDRRSFPRNKLCGEYLNCGAVRELTKLNMDSELRSEALQMRGMRLYAHGENAEFRFPAEAWSLPRMLLDERLRSRALQAGATAVRGGVHSIENGGSGVQIRLTDGPEQLDVRARYAIGADGMHSAIARLLNLTRPARCSRFAVGGHYRHGAFSNWLEMYVARSGYVAINPLQGDFTNAVFVLSQAHLERHRKDLGGELRRFSYEASNGHRLFSDRNLSGRRLGAGPLAHATRSVRDGNVILAGDAAGFVDPFTGQGVYLALAGARLAASALSRALRDRSSAPVALADYALALQDVARDRKRLAWLVPSILKSGFLSRHAARALRRRPDNFGLLVDAVSGHSFLSVNELVCGMARAFA